MVSRLAEVIHYFGFGVGVASGAYIFVLAMINDISTGDLLIQYIFALATFGVCAGLGWVVRYILVGKIPFNPFEKD